MDQKEIPHDPRHLAVPLGVSKMISKPVVNSAQIMHLSCVKLALSPSRLNRASTWASSFRNSIKRVKNDFWAYGTFSANCAPILHRHWHYIQIDRNVIRRHQGVPSGASKMISEPMVRSAQTVHLSCVKTSTISKWTESSFHLSLVTWEYQWLHPK
jgi:hypothetical protein